MGGNPGVNTSGRADIGGVHLFYEARGTGRPVVLVHGGLLGRRLWDSMLAPLSRRYRIYRFDQRGYGDSDRPAGVYSYWEDLKKLADVWELPSAVYVGFGEGAATVIDFALAYPDRVAGMVLISPYLHGYDYSPAFQANLLKLGDAYLTTGGSAVADALMRDQSYPPAAAKADERKRLRELIMENAHVLAFNWMHVRPLEPLAARRLGELAAPALVLAGDRDTVDNLSASDRLRYEVPGAAHKSIPGGHVLPVDAPAAVTEAINAFLSTLPPA